VTCTTTGTTESSPGGDTTVVDGGLIDAVLGTVNNAPDAVSLCFEYHYD
jgi:hypothetical protein